MSFPKRLEGYLNIFDYVSHRNTLQSSLASRGKFKLVRPGQKQRMTRYSPLLSARLHGCPLPRAAAAASDDFDPLRSEPKRCRREERRTNRSSENINKNIKRRHLLFDCCVHLCTSLHHYGLFSLQIKPKTVQITRRLKSF